MVQLGLLLTRGKIAPADPIAAGLLWRLAAARGDTTAAYNLGAMLEVGFGVARNPAWARYWYAMAANAGHAQAQEALKRVSGP
jgi:TPR repeat protein